MSDIDLSRSVFRFVEQALGELEASVAPGLRLPRIFGGHLVRSDARADLLHILALLVQAGTERVAGVDLRSRAHELLLELDPDEVEGFYSYRVAESVNLLGGLSSLGPSVRHNAVAASRSPRLVRDIVEDASRRSPNFTVVAARCLYALEQLGLPTDDLQERRVREETVGLFCSASEGWINDGRLGHLQFDIYTPEMYLLAEPFRDRMEPCWRSGMSRVLVDLEKLCQPSGVVTWGRSVGALANAMSLELSVVSLLHGFDNDRAWWLSVGHGAAADLQGWFRSGLITADQSWASDPYRGPARRLQQTFDLLGKMAWSASRLCDLREPLPPRRDVWPDVDDLIRFPSRAAAWAHRSRPLSFILPLMAGRSADYLPSPRCPGLFEQPIEGFPLMIPTVTAPIGTSEQVHLVPAGTPIRIIHDPSQIEVQYDGWAPVGAAATTPSLEGSRTAVYRVVGRSLEVREHLRIDDAPQGSALTLAIGEVPGRPLRLEVDSSHSSVLIDTGGMAEWRTHWSELERIHQVEIELRQRTNIRFNWKVTPSLLVATTDPDHQYSRSLYGAMPDVAVVPAGPPDEDLARRLRSVDLLHVAWPERWVGLNPDASRHTIAQLRAAGVRIVWTQHNLLPHHDRSEEARHTYSLWANAADGVIHHSHYGREIAQAFHRYPPHVRHYVIPHGHWGSYFPTPSPDRGTVEAEEGWPSASIRLAVIGQPRREKTLQAVVTAVARSDRDDIQLVARLSVETQVPPDPRIIATYGHLEAARYYRRLTAVDGVIFPFEGDTMLTTGTAFDCIGGGIAPIASPWGFLRETFGDAAIWCGAKEDDLVTCLSSLTSDSLRAAGSATRSLQPRHDWYVIGEQTSHAFEDIVLKAAL